MVGSLNAIEGCHIYAGEASYRMMEPTLDRAVSISCLHVSSISCAAEETTSPLSLAV